ncbi:MULTISPECIES: ribokinase [Carnobacterium]|uniref:Ribokinase n=1 Tax=Carnobacterium antarcticum TaxID=2126436 RepID=A0ABW4NQV9_9LACT|nr:MULTISPECIES: ribokinase [unclassified Carnobacterium]ALV21407.1 Ribokinase [Carnobacterium sp. CP1]QQP69417.1 ribokinase [Carnobacterium sp. CS13]
MSKITVVGSLSTDFVVSADKRPEIGETITGKDFKTTFGGKGANQAVAAARLGSRVSMIGTVGTDLFGQEIIANLKNNQINTDNVESVTGLPSGSAHITVVDGDNSIVYIPGANDAITHEQVISASRTIEESDVVILQNETPLEIIESLIDICFQKGIQTIYNPAPAKQIKQETIEKVTFLTPNESEYNVLFPQLSISEGLKKHPNKLIVTMGSKGVYFNDGSKEVQIPSYLVQPVDTTGAGDTFNGAFGVALTSGLDMESSIRFGNLAAALSIQTFGAQGGMPTLEEMKGSAFYEKEWNLK